MPRKSTHQEILSIAIDISDCPARALFKWVSQSRDLKLVERHSTLAEDINMSANALNRVDSNIDYIFSLLKFGFKQN